MKKLLSMLVVVAAITAGCTQGGTAGEDARDSVRTTAEQTTQSQSAVNSTTAEKTASLDIPLSDSDQLTVRVVDVADNVITLAVTNKLESIFIMSEELFAANGYMLSADVKKVTTDSSMHPANIDPKADAVMHQVIVSKADMAAAGIDTLQTIKLTLNAVLVAGEGDSEVIVAEANLTGQANSVSYDTAGDVVYDADDFLIVNKGLVADSTEAIKPMRWLIVNARTDDVTAINLDYFYNDVEIGTGGGGVIFKTVYAGYGCYVDVKFPADKLSEAGIDELKKLSFILQVDNEDGSKLTRSDLIELSYQ